MQRCCNTKSQAYKDYGARGIKVCPRWQKFENFYADMGEPPTPKHQLDRRDNDKGYSKSNCRWVTAKENNRNTRRNHFLIFRGKALPIEAWVERIGISSNVLYRRLALGWSVEKALTSPVKVYSKRRVL